MRRRRKGPVQSAEGESAGADGGLGEQQDVADAERSRRRVPGQAPQHDAIGRHEDGNRPPQGTLPQPCLLPAQVDQTAAVSRELGDGPLAQPEQPHFLRGRRVHRQPVGVLGPPLCIEHLSGVTVPEAALPQQPVRRCPGAADQHGCPPRVPGEQGGLSQSGHRLDQASGDEPHRQVHRRARDAQVEVAGAGEPVRQVFRLQMPHPLRSCRGEDEPVVQPAREPVAEIGTHLHVQGRQQLHGDEHRAYGGQRTQERGVAVDGGHQRRHSDRDERGKDAPRHDERPPRPAETQGRTREYGEELPLVSVPQLVDHACPRAGFHRIVLM